MGCTINFLQKIFKKHSKRLFKYALVGVSGTLINLSVLYLLTEFAHMWYLTSEIIATLIAFVTNYTANTLWTYRDAMKKLEEEKL